MNALPRILARFTFLRCLALLSVLLGAASPALATDTYTNNGDDTVTDPTTGLTWMRCAMGQTSTGGTCLGTVQLYTWADANALTGAVTFAGHNDWRLPNIRELQSIVDRAAYGPAIDSIAFPNTPTDSFWSASAYASWPNFAWYVFFQNGNADADPTSYGIRVRLVRGGQSFSSLLNPARPTSDYVDHGNGTVTHTPTGLMWQRCANGQTWTDNTCSGSATEHSWDVAQAMTDSFAGQSDWRLPTEDELLTLVDYTTFNPAANATIFPAMHASYFWSSSAYVNPSSSAWYVGFYFGDTSGYYKTYPFQVRFVRTGSPGGTSASVSVSRSGAGSGTVTSSPAGINCGSTCSADFNFGISVTLTAAAAPDSTFTGWSGACSGIGTCTVSMTQAQNVTATFAVVPVSTVSPYDGIYQWDPGYYLSVHQIGGEILIGTIYWVYNANPEQVGARAISEADTFDLFHGQLVGSTATMTGTRFYRACTHEYDFTFNPDSSLTVRLDSVSNSPGVSVADVDCAARYNTVGSVWTIPRIY